MVNTTDQRLSRAHKPCLAGPSKFGAVNEFDIVPVIDISEGVPILTEALAWAEWIS